MTEQEISNFFTYHSPDLIQTCKYKNLRLAAKNLAILIEESCPTSAEKSIAIERLRETIMWANSSIACNE